MNNNEQNMYDALKTIKGFMTPAKIRKNSENTGLDYEEYLEIAYEDIRELARVVLYKIRRPK